jgi:hypothetical protein
LGQELVFPDERILERVISLFLILLADFILENLLFLVKLCQIMALDILIVFDYYLIRFKSEDAKLFSLHLC